ncbi:MAG: sugar isomerase, partial [Bacteroidota bacterium]
MELLNDLKEHIASHNATDDTHQKSFDFLKDHLTKAEVDVEALLKLIRSFQVAIPSWALGAGGTRFGRFRFSGEPATLEDKIDDVGIIHQLTKNAGAISLHIPWDIPTDFSTVKEKAAQYDLIFDAMNSNTFQDQPAQVHSYKFGSLGNESAEIRAQAIQHNLEVIRLGEQLGSKSLTIWLADGSTFPGQASFQRSLAYTQQSLEVIYKNLPTDWRVLIEYKPYEPNFYHTIIQDWGTSYMLASSLGEKAYTLVDLGHHLPNTNIENIVATLLYTAKLGGFHFNDSKYGDDDLTVGSIKPYQLFLIFNELVGVIRKGESLSWMIDASHNIKDPLEDLMQSIEAILIALTQALLIDK